MAAVAGVSGVSVDVLDAGAAASSSSSSAAAAAAAAAGVSSGVSSGVTSGVSSGVTISYSEAVESGVAPPPRKRARVSAADAALMNSNAEFLARAAALKLPDERAVRRADAIICSGVRHNVSNATKSFVSHSFDVVMDTKTR